MGTWVVTGWSCTCETSLLRSKCLLPVPIILSPANIYKHLDFFRQQEWIVKNLHWPPSRHEKFPWATRSSGLIPGAVILPCAFVAQSRSVGYRNLITCLYRNHHPRASFYLASSLRVWDDHFVDRDADIHGFCIPRTLRPSSVSPVDLCPMLGSHEVALLPWSHWSLLSSLGSKSSKNVFWAWNQSKPRWGDPLAHRWQKAEPETAFSSSFRKGS